MSKSVFLSPNRYWREIDSRIARATNVMAAIAYFGSGGSDFLPLRSGHKLVVDLSISAVKQGVTDPREIKKLMMRGVEVFTRSSLHAKVVIIDDAVIVGSANVSTNSRRNLEEAGILSTSKSSVQEASRFVRELCSEPVLEGYLKECIKQYKPPVFKGARTVSRRSKQNQKNAKLWYVGGLVYVDPERDKDQVDPLEEESRRELLDPKHSEVSWIRYGHLPAWFSRIHKNNWIIDCTRSGKRTRMVGSPARVISKRRYKSKAGKTYHMLMLERPSDSELMSLSEFQRRWRRVATKSHLPPKRTQPISDDVLADRILRFWNRRGSVARKMGK